jgi:hypothetical protein
VFEVRKERVIQTQMSRESLHFFKVVHTNGHQFRTVLFELRVNLLELNELTLAYSSEMSTEEDNSDALISFQQIKKRNFIVGHVPEGKVLG